MSFKKDFIWGAATASYQIEGAAYEDGKGLSVWDMFTKIESKIYEFHNGDVACDHYHLFKEDVKIMQELGLKAYRFSLSWPRILPNGIGPVNEKGLAFYDALIDALLEANIEPYITLFHWDYPYDLYRKGGWLNNDSPDWFAEYTEVVVKRYSDRVTHWMTLNEPQCFIGLGHVVGDHAPGLKLGEQDFAHLVHNTLLAHGKAVQIIRQYAVLPPLVGFAPVGHGFVPATETAEDIEATRQAFFDIIPKDLRHMNFCNGTWLDPVYLGKYHPDVEAMMIRHNVSTDLEADMALISTPLDFVGYNQYTAGIIEMDKDGKPAFVKRKPGFATNKMSWPVEENSLYWSAKFFSERYKKPIIITENGLSLSDWVSIDGKVHDPNRIDFLNRYLLGLKRAASEGIDIAGYFQWSLMDNFEWGHGYKDRFGLVFVDYSTQKRTIKDSGYWYRTVIESNGNNL